MNMHDVSHLSRRMAALFPKNDWTPDMLTLLGRRCVKFNLSTEQIDAVLDEYRATARHRSPVMSDLINRLRDAQGSPKGPGVSQAQSGDAPANWRTLRPPVTAWNHELAARFDANPEDPVFENLKAKGVSVFVATRGMRGKATGPAEVEAAASVLAGGGA